MKRWSSYFTIVEFCLWRTCLPLIASFSMANSVYSDQFSLCHVSFLLVLLLRAPCIVNEWIASRSEGYVIDCSALYALARSDVTILLLGYEARLPATWILQLCDYLLQIQVSVELFISFQEFGLCELGNRGAAERMVTSNPVKLS